MNQAASYLTTRRVFWWFVQMEDLYRQKEGEIKVKRVDYFRQGHLPLGEGRDFYQADYLTGDGQEILDWLI